MFSFLPFPSLQVSKRWVEVATSLCKTALFPSSGFHPKYESLDCHVSALWNSGLRMNFGVSSHSREDLLIGVFPIVHSLVASSNSQ